MGNTVSLTPVIVPIPAEARPAYNRCDPLVSNNRPQPGGEKTSSACSQVPVQVPYTGHLTLRMLPPADAAQKELAHELFKKDGWFNQAEKAVEKGFGLRLAARATANVELRNYDGVGGLGALVKHQIQSGDVKGRYSDVVIDMSDFDLSTHTAGLDRLRKIVNHEFVHLYMGQTMNYRDLHDKDYFVEGTAELLIGADENVKNALEALGGKGMEQALVDEVGKGRGHGDYIAGYVSMRYLHAQIKAAGGTGMRDMMAFMSTNQTPTLDEAFAHMAKTLGGAVKGYTSEAAFLADFKENGARFIREKMDLTNDDNGAIGGADAR
jgi:flagellin